MVMLIVLIVVALVEVLGLLWVIIDSKKFKKKCEEEGILQPPVDVKERVSIYLFTIVLPTIIGFVLNKWG